MLRMDVNGKEDRNSGSSRSCSSGYRSPETGLRGVGSTTRATAKDVAREVGVSPSTVSNAYNNPGELSEALRERVLAAARRLGYPGPNPLGRSLRRQRADAVGVLFGNRLSYAFADPGVIMFLRGVSEAVEEAGLGLVLLPSLSLGTGESVAIRGAALDGVVIHDMAPDDPLVGAVLERQLPAVVVDQPSIGEVTSVSVDDEGGARAVAEHVLGLGHRNLGVVSSRLALEARSGTVDPDQREAATLRPSGSRLAGYATAVRASGISWEEIPVYECPESTPGEGKAAARDLLRRQCRPTAILAVSDQLAFGVIEAAEELGLSVPDDLSVVGFDDVPEAERSNPPLTTVSQPHAAKGLLAGRKLIIILRGEDPGGPELLPTRLVVRGSTANAD